MLGCIASIVSFNGKWQIHYCTMYSSMKKNIGEIISQKHMVVHKHKHVKLVVKAVNKALKMWTNPLCTSI